MNTLVWANPDIFHRNGPNSHLQPPLFSWTPAEKSLVEMGLYSYITAIDSSIEDIKLHLFPTIMGRRVDLFFDRKEQLGSLWLVPCSIDNKKFEAFIDPQLETVELLDPSELNVQDKEVLAGWHFDSEQTERAIVALRSMSHAASLIDAEAPMIAATGAIQFIKDHAKSPDVVPKIESLAEITAGILDRLRSLLEEANDLSKKHRRITSEDVQLFVDELKKIRLHIKVLKEQLLVPSLREAFDEIPSDADFHLMIIRNFETAITLLQNRIDHMTGMETRKPEPLDSILTEISKNKRSVKIKGLLLPAFVMADRVSLKSALNNVIRNAVYFADKANGENAEVIVSLQRENGHIKIVIRDNGDGIPSEMLEIDPETERPRLFTLNGSLRKGGTGIGLTETWFTIKSCGGSVHAANESGKGSIFTIYLPLIKDGLTDKKSAAPIERIAGPDKKDPAISGSPKVERGKRSFEVPETKAAGPDVIMQAIGKMAAIALIPLATFIIILSIPIIKLSSRGPIFYKQKRVGEGGRTITVWKLRTMTTETDPEDRKVTFFGKLVRLPGFDELPQILSIIKGDLQWFGPRPYVREEIDQEYIDTILHGTKPGLFSLRALKVHGEGWERQTDIPKKETDIEYLSRKSWIYNTEIAAKTIIFVHIWGLIKRLAIPFRIRRKVVPQGAYGGEKPEAPDMARKKNVDDEGELSKLRSALTRSAGFIRAFRGHPFFLSGVPDDTAKAFLEGTVEYHKIGKALVISFDDLVELSRDSIKGRELAKKYKVILVYGYKPFKEGEYTTDDALQALGVLRVIAQALVDKKTSIMVFGQQEFDHAQFTEEQIARLAYPLKNFPHFYHYTGEDLVSYNPRHPEEPLNFPASAIEPDKEEVHPDRTVNGFHIYNFGSTGININDVNFHTEGKSIPVEPSKEYSAREHHAPLATCTALIVFDKNGKPIEFCHYKTTFFSKGQLIDIEHLLMPENRFLMILGPLDFLDLQEDYAEGFKAHLKSLGIPEENVYVHGSEHYQKYKHKLNSELLVTLLGNGLVRLDYLDPDHSFDMSQETEVLSLGDPEPLTQGSILMSNDRKGKPQSPDMTLSVRHDSFDEVSYGDRTNPFILGYIEEEKAVEIDEKSETVHRIKRRRSNPRDPPLEEKYRSNETFEKIRQAKDPVLLRKILEDKQNFRNLSASEKEELIQVAQKISLSFILGKVLIQETEEDEIVTHVRSGFSKKKGKHDLDPTIWIGEVLFSRMSDEQLAQLLLEESQHVLKPPKKIHGKWRNLHGKISEAENPSGVIEHDEDFIWSLDLSPVREEEFAATSELEEEVLDILFSALAEINSEPGCKRSFLAYSAYLRKFGKLPSQKEVALIAGYSFKKSGPILFKIAQTLQLHDLPRLVFIKKSGIEPETHNIPWDLKIEEKALLRLDPGGYNAILARDYFPFAQKKIKKKEDFDSDTLYLDLPADGDEEKPQATDMAKEKEEEIIDSYKLTKDVLIRSAEYHDRVIEFMSQLSLRTKTEDFMPSMEDISNKLGHLVYFTANQRSGNRRQLALEALSEFMRNLREHVWQKNRGLDFSVELQIVRRKSDSRRGLRIIATSEGESINIPAALQGKLARLGETASSYGSFTSTYVKGIFFIKMSRIAKKYKDITFTIESRNKGMRFSHDREEPFDPDIATNRLSVTIFELADASDEENPEPPDTQNPEPVERTDSHVVLVNGTKLHCRTMGRDDGPAIVVVHGGPGFDHNYLLASKEGAVNPFLRLAKKYRLIFYDQRASGESGGREDLSSITVDNFVDDIEGIRKAFGLEKVHLMGHSWGGLLAMLYAARRPDKVRSLTLFHPMPENSSKLRVSRIRRSKRWQADGFDEKDTDQPDYWEGFFAPYFYRRENVREVGCFLHPRIKEDMRVLFKRLRRFLMSYDITEELTQIACPALIISGEHDLVSLRGLGEIMDSAEMHETQECGHFSFFESPDEFFNRVSAFLGEAGDDEKPEAPDMARNKKPAAGAEGKKHAEHLPEVINIKTLIEEATNNAMDGKYDVNYKGLTAKITLSLSEEVHVVIHPSAWKDKKAEKDKYIDNWKLAFRQAFTELLKNAVEGRHGYATGKARNKITYVTVEVRVEDGNILTCIKDDGDGIAEKGLQVYRDLLRGKIPGYKSLAKERPGGLGLKVLSNAAAEIGADVEIKTKPVEEFGEDSGTIATITLPLEIKRTFSAEEIDETENLRKIKIIKKHPADSKSPDTPAAGADEQNPKCFNAGRQDAKKVLYRDLEFVEKYDGVRFGRDKDHYISERTDDFDPYHTLKFTQKTGEEAHLVREAVARALALFRETTIRSFVSDKSDEAILDLYESFWDDVRRHEGLLIRVASNLPWDSALYETGGVSVLVLNKEFFEDALLGYYFPHGEDEHKNTALWLLCERLNHELCHSGIFKDDENEELKEEAKCVYRDLLFFKLVLLSIKNRTLKDRVDKYVKNLKNRYGSNNYYKFLYSLMGLSKRKAKAKIWAYVTKHYKNRSFGIKAFPSRYHGPQDKAEEDEDLTEKEPVVLYNPNTGERIRVRYGYSDKRGFPEGSEEWFIEVEDDGGSFVEAGFFIANFSDPHVLTQHDINVEESYRRKGIAKTVKRWLALKAWEEGKKLAFSDTMNPIAARINGELYKLDTLVLTELGALEDGGRLITEEPITEDNIKRLLLERKFRLAIENREARGVFSVEVVNSETGEMKDLPSGCTAHITEDMFLVVRDRDGSLIKTTYGLPLNFVGEVDREKIIAAQEKDSGPAALRFIQKFTAPYRPYEAYALINAPVAEETIFTLVPFAVFSALLATGVLGLYGFLAGMALTYASFVALHAGNVWRAPPEVTRIWGKLRYAFKTPLSVASFNMLTSTVFGSVLNYMLQGSMPNIVVAFFTALFTWTAFEFGKMAHKEANKNATEKGDHAPAAIGMNWGFSGGHYSSNILQLIIGNLLNTNSQLRKKALAVLGENGLIDHEGLNKLTGDVQSYLIAASAIGAGLQAYVQTRILLVNQLEEMDLQRFEKTVTGMIAETRQLCEALGVDDIYALDLARKFIKQGKDARIIKHISQPHWWVEVDGYMIDAFPEGMGKNSIKVIRGVGDTLFIISRKNSVIAKTLYKGKEDPGLTAGVRHNAFDDASYYGHWIDAISTLLGKSIWQLRMSGSTDDEIDKHPLVAFFRKKLEKIKADFIQSSDQLGQNKERTDELRTPDDDSPAPATLRSLKRILMPEMPFDEYATNVAPKLEEGIFTFLPFTVLSILLWSGTIGFFGFLMGMGISWASFLLAHLPRITRAPPEANLSIVESITQALRAPVTIIVQNFFVAAIYGFLITLLSPINLSIVFPIMLSVAQYMIAEMVHRNVNIQALSKNKFAPAVIQRRRFESGDEIAQETIESYAREHVAPFGSDYKKILGALIEDIRESFGGLAKEKMLFAVALLIALEKNEKTLRKAGEIMHDKRSLAEQGYRITPEMVMLFRHLRESNKEEFDRLRWQIPGLNKAIVTDPLFWEKMGDLARMVDNELIMRLSEEKPRLFEVSTEGILQAIQKNEFPIANNILWQLHHRGVLPDNSFVTELSEKIRKLDRTPDNGMLRNEIIARISAKGRGRRARFDDKGPTSFIHQGGRSKKAFESAPKKDITAEYRERSIALIEKVLKSGAIPEEKSPELMALRNKLDDGTYKIYGFESIVRGTNDFFLGWNNPEENKLFIATDLIDKLYERGPPTLVDEYLLHELICPSLGHYPAILVQQAIYPARYADDLELHNQLPEYPYKGLLGAALREHIDNNIVIPMTGEFELREAIVDQKEYKNVTLHENMQYPIIEVVINGKKYRIGNGFYLVITLANGKKVYWSGQHNFSYSFFFEHFKEDARSIISEGGVHWRHIDMHSDMVGSEMVPSRSLQECSWQKEASFGSHKLWGGRLSGTSSFLGRDPETR
ncbi:alpha/beta fold hydrolase [Candidatus Omnitrophota bacterium]